MNKVPFEEVLVMTRAQSVSIIGMLALVGAGAAVFALRAPTAAGEGVSVTVYKSPTCGCCSAWVDHLREAGFTVAVEDVTDLGPVKRRAGVPVTMESCHTAFVDGYVLEGHVPADLVNRLLDERPPARGLAVPGMPMGSPGMEGPRQDPYDVLLFDQTGQATVYASR